MEPLSEPAPPTLDVLAFSTNWNRAKLDCDCFTTLRLSDRFQVGQRVEVFLGKVYLGVGAVIGKKRLEAIHQINDWMAHLDTGYDANECRQIIQRMYPSIKDWGRQPIYFYLLKIDRQSRPGASVK